MNAREKRCAPEPNSPEKSLGNPSLEVLDPTPDIHLLFNQFNYRFFTGKLLSVCLRWSKRMYSCAGICRYEGRGGFCEIALSEPLLKLRSRKNLVETLLHEMIHAYLFVTRQNRDRDGHGPDFHEHMYRINKEANINITVYHNFRDEVDLYKTHWWRCEGPCRNNEPFFGLVRRSSNRAPGPNDFWWKKHQYSCGGVFIKIKEPEKKLPKKIKGIPMTSNKDIRNFFKSPSKNTSDSSINQFTPPPKRFKIDNPSQNKKLPNSSNTKSSVSTTIHSTPQTSKQLKTDTPNLNNKRPSTSNDNKLNIPKPKFNVSPISEPQSSKQNNVTETVRNHWINKYNNVPSVSKPKSTSENKPEIAPGEDFSDFNGVMQELYGKDFTLKSDHFHTPPKKIWQEMCSECPICNMTISKNTFNEHLKNCVQILNNDNNLPEQETLVSNVVDLTYIDNSPLKSDSKMVSCPACNKNVPINSLDEHLEECLEKTFEDDNIDKIVCCPACNKNIHTGSLEEHLEKCLEKTFEDDTEEFVPIPKKDNSNSNPIRLYDSDDNEVSTDNSASNITNRFPCPCCLNLIDENVMNDHLDSCLS